MGESPPAGVGGGSERIGAIREYQIEKSNLRGRETAGDDEVGGVRDDEEGSNFGNLSNSSRRPHRFLKLAEGSNKRGLPPRERG